ncbi:MAG: metallophosphoesterase [Planctomycetota bacterium]|jgi:3',5'-cyclic AMP phosphodiesterase CpdA
MKNQPFFFIQISDPQFGMFPTNGDIFHETQLFEKAIDHANRLGPTFVISTGDLVNNPGDEKQLAAGLHTLQKFDKSIPFYLLPGNHDVGDAPTEQSLSWYRKNIGKDWYSFDYGQWHFIGLNSCIIAQGQHVLQDVEKQWDWLINDLERNSSPGNSHIIVFMHHPLFLKDPEEADNYFNIPRRMRQDYLNLLRKHDVEAVLTGHLHQNNLTTNSQLEVITTGPVGMPLGPESSGFRIVKVYGNRIEHKYFGLFDVISHDF